MIVKELIEKLSTFDENTEVLDGEENPIDLVIDNQSTVIIRAEYPTRLIDKL